MIAADIIQFPLKKKEVPATPIGVVGSLIMGLLHCKRRFSYQLLYVIPSGKSYDYHNGVCKYGQSMHQKQREEKEEDVSFTVI